MAQHVTTCGRNAKTGYFEINIRTEEQRTVIRDLVTRRKLKDLVTVDGVVSDHVFLSETARDKGALLINMELDKNERRASRQRVAEPAGHIAVGARQPAVL